MNLTGTIEGTWNNLNNHNKKETEFSYHEI